MPQTMWRRSGSVFASLRLLLLLLSLLFSHVCGAASTDGGDVEDAAELTRREYRCRTCVTLATVFQEEILRPAAGMQQAMSAAAGRKESDAVRAGARQRLVVNMHDSIDGLCHRVRELHRAENKMRAVDASGLGSAEERRDKLRLHEDDLLGSRRALRGAVDDLCEAVLEEVNEPLSQKAFAALLPNGVRPDEASATESDAAHQLGGAGAFCERQGICRPSTLQTIAREDATRRRLVQQRTNAPQHSLPWWGASKAALVAPAILLVLLTAGILLYCRRKWRTTAVRDAHTKRD
ncbi:hypothetical protein TraAM80_03127 [Trypanosoma rangeli]|uniref:Uncharacterized protein n=1 Tax=Trypanosoma rangeli TaxID=5698 RepID=A0A3R7M2H5_TRYRA|nr:uncharacterized protein TraAM80_03127 [Trypanosoma rangeli]RNF07869.1 hypothetical protein TraAM80_03127 [Trypanosoma rangeli]|eukprot:RNF07869.1 hypothetical protein TraAM80_03127 [Trypanosoma rangeli]